MLDVILTYLMLLVVVSLKTWLIGFLWVLAATIAASSITGHKVSQTSIRRALRLAAMWPIIIPKWALIAWLFTFPLSMLWLAYWLVVTPIVQQLRHRRAAEPAAPDISQP